MQVVTLNVSFLRYNGRHIGAAAVKACVSGRKHSIDTLTQATHKAFTCYKCTRQS